MRAALLLLALSACADYNFQKEEEETPITMPVLQIEPPLLDFGAAAEGEPVQRTITLRNAGTAGLRVFGVEAVGSPAFSMIPGEFPQDLAPGESLSVPVYFSAVNVEHEATLFIESSDPETPLAEVPMVGEGLIPRLIVAPLQGQFGPVGVGCQDALTFSMTSVGNAPVTVSQLVSTGAGFVVRPPSLPFTLQPGDFRTFVVRWTPSALGSAAGRLWVSSDDPADDDSVVLSGLGVVAGELTEEFLQASPTGKTDIFLYVDRSGSMGDDLVNLIGNIGHFSETLAGLETDWQLMVATRDDGCHDGAMIGPQTVDLPDAFYTALDGDTGILTESGLSIARNALRQSARGACNEGFLRPGAHTALLMMSDEPEQSRTHWSSLVAEMQDIAPELTISAIAGPVPGGCETAAPGTGYYEASLATGGTFFSICDDDWGARLESLAAASTGLRNFFPLSRTPVADSVRVLLDGTELTEGWTYVEDLQAVRIAEAPAPGTVISVRYLWDGACE